MVVKERIRFLERERVSGHKEYTVCRGKDNKQEGVRCKLSIGST